jgi:hypothetical protein
MAASAPRNDNDLFDALVDELVVTPEEIAAAHRAAVRVAAVLRRAFRPSADDADTRDDYLIAGSVGKRLAIRPMPAVDLLYLLSADTAHADLPAQMEAAVGAAFPGAEAMAGDGSLRIPVDGLMIAVSPALEHQGAFAMARREGWVITNPVAEMAALRLSDALSGGRTTRLALLIKAWKAACHVALPSFAVEVLAREFCGEIAPSDWPGTLADFFAWARQRTPKSFDLPGGLDRLTIDDAWHPAAETAYWRCVLAGHHAAAGDHAAAIDEWRTLLGPRFAAPDF